VCVGVRRRFSLSFNLRWIVGKGPTVTFFRARKVLFLEFLYLGFVISQSLVPNLPPFFLETVQDFGALRPFDGLEGL